jgi:hypothetical protein
MSFLTTADLAARYGVAPVTARSWCERGLFPNVMRGPKTGRGATYLIPESDLVRFTPPQQGRPPSASTLSKRCLVTEEV